MTTGLVELADKWQDEAAGTWGESVEHATLQRCSDELRALVAQALSVPEGFVLVPREPTPQMVEHVRKQICDGTLSSRDTADVYRAMIEAITAPLRYVVLKASGSHFAYVQDTHEGRTVKRYNIFKGDGWEYAKRHAEILNRKAAAPEPVAVGSNNLSSDEEEAP